MSTFSLNKYPKTVQYWLWLGVVMVFGQVALGGITRLTDSGLSITEWKLILGIFPPLNAAEWQDAFTAYQKHAKTQFEAIHDTMTLNEFKWIYFWEYFHRLWARLMGFVFIIPFFFFLAKKQIDGKLIKRLGIVILLAMFAATIGWIMVKSGLDTPERAWVSAYKLMVHLGIGFSLFAYLLWTTFHTLEFQERLIHIGRWKRIAGGICILIFVQILLGGLMSGMKAGLSYPTWPDMNGVLIPSVVFEGSNWTLDNWIWYNRSVLAPTVIQILHRFTAYALTFIILWFIFKAKKVNTPYIFRRSLNLLGIFLIVQFILGIYTVINCKGSIPVTLGALHQLGGLLLLGASVFTYFLTKKSID